MRDYGDAFVMIASGLALLTAMTVAEAKAFADPTRPPSVSENGAAPAAPGAAQAGLQAIIRRQGAKPGAVINGEYVELGGKSGDARVVAIGDGKVTLQGPSGQETLLLLPGVEKKPAAADDTGGKAGGKKAGTER
jgi:MSHA biogenesis protein MshK